MAEDSLSHVYDPVKRREYYLKKRQLKGRKRGSAITLKPRVKSKAEIAKERHAHLQEQVAVLKGRLERLQAALKVLVAQAKARSGVKPTATSTAKKTAATQQKANAKPQKLTAAQKKAKAEAEKKARREKAVKDGTANNSQLSDEVKSLNEKLKTIQARIEKMHKSGAIGSRTNTKK
jgi:translation initiation factor IF-2